MDMLFTSTNLLMLWIFTGIICFIPLIVKSTFFKYAVVAVVLSVVYTTFMVNKEFIGRARYESFVEEFIYKAHSISKINSVKYITLWVHDGRDDLLIRFPHTDEKQKQLEKARERSRKGIITEGQDDSKEEW
jgi:hypothetical protein